MIGRCIVRALLGGVGALALVPAAGFAADMRVKAPAAPMYSPMYSWSGPYIGVNAGYAWGRSDASTTATCGANPPFYFNCGNQAAVQASGTGSFSPDGFAGGVQAGYNWQAGNLVYGIELDFGALNLRASRTTASAYVALAAGSPFATTISSETNWLFTARGRLGWAVTPNTLIYATGGLALTDIKIANRFTDIFNAFGAASNDEVKAGWAVGGGAEWMVARHWTIKAEYLYVDFGQVSVSSTVIEPVGSPGASSALTTSADLRTHIARAGINYKF